MNNAMLNTSDLLRATALAYPGRVMVVDGQHSFTYAQFDAMVDCFAGWFLTSGGARGFRAAYLLGNQWEVLLTYHAVGRAGGVIVPLNSRLTPQEISFLLDEAAVEFVVYDPDFEALFTEAVGARSLETIAAGSVKGAARHALESILASTQRPAPLAFPHVSANDDSGIWFTSGTTGKPKGAVVTHGSSVFCALLTSGAVGVSSETRLVSAAPLFHRGAVEDVHLAVTMMGGVHFLAKRFEPKQTLELLESTRATFAFIVPTMAQMMLEVPDHGSYDLSHLRCWMSASAPLREDLQERIRSELRIPTDALANVYGITESLINTFCLGTDLLKRPRSAGKPVPLTEVRILGQDHEFLRPGEIGEIVISGPCQLRTYLGRQEDYVNTMLETEGKRWYRSGDLGYLDQDGFLFIVDRSKDMIITGGENVYSVEVEIALAEQSDVAEVAVIGEPDAKWGERVVAVIVPKNGRQPIESDLLQACNAIANYKRPKRFVFLDSLPRNSFGKVQKSALRDIVKSIP